MSLRRTSRVTVVATCLLLGILLLGWRFRAFYTDPRGLYEDEGLGVVGTAYYELRNGRIQLVLPEGQHENAGHYFKRGTTWVWVTQLGSEFHLVPSLTELRIFYPDGRALERDPFKRLFFRPRVEPE